MNCKYYCPESGHLPLCEQRGMNDIDDELVARIKQEMGMTEVPVGLQPGFTVTENGRIVPIKKSVPKPETEVTPRPPCTEHREKSFTFSDGETWTACTADGCLFGKGRKTHSDGSKHHEPFVDDMPFVKETDDGEGLQEIQTELLSPARGPVAGEDDPEELDAFDSEHADESDADEDELMGVR